MLRRDLELAADVVADELSEKVRAFVGKHIVIPYAGADEHLFHLRHGGNGIEQLYILGVVGFEIFTRFRRETSAVQAHPVLQLFVAGGVSEIGSRSADIVDISLEIRHRGDLLRLFDAGLNAS